jgi:hypothetical protein
MRTRTSECCLAAFQKPYTLSIVHAFTIKMYGTTPINIVSSLMCYCCPTSTTSSRTFFSCLAIGDTDDPTCCYSLVLNTDQATSSPMIPTDPHALSNLVKDSPVPSAGAGRISISSCPSSEPPTIGSISTNGDFKGDDAVRSYPSIGSAVMTSA